MKTFLRTYNYLIVTVIFFLLTIQLASAQIVFRGTVTDAETKEPVEMATVRLSYGSGERLINYCLTNAKGTFSVPAEKQTDSLQISVSMLGYKTFKQKVTPGDRLQIELKSEAINLREVVVRPGRIWARKDTVNYSISDFLSSKDESIKDVIKKLPGIEVDNSGKISYNGKGISNFYVEGMDITGGRYNQINNNLQAKAVDAVQVMENHQSVRMLKDKINTEDVAINLKLKPEFRDKWMVNLMAGAGFSPDNASDKWLWQTDLNALQLSRQSQSVYTYKNNNMGKDITDEQKMLLEKSARSLSETSVPSFLQQPSLMAPLKTERLLFNDVHTFSANRLYRLGENSQFRINSIYAHDLRKQERGSETVYYLPDDTLAVAEQSRTSIRSDKAEVSLNFENNAAERFLTNKFIASGMWEKGKSEFLGNTSFEQQIRTNNLNLKNDLQSMWNKGGYTLELRSLLRYNHLPAKLQVDKNLQNLNLNYFYTDNSFSILKKKGYFTQRYITGFKGEVNNIRNGYSIYHIPYWQYNKNKWRNTLTVPVKWTAYPGKLSRPAVSPSLSVNYKHNYSWSFYVYGSYNESYGSIIDLYDRPYYTDYRHVIVNNGKLGISRNQLYSVYGEYKNTIKEFFATLSLSYSPMWSNRIAEQLFDNNEVVLAYRPESTKSNSWTIRGTLSKGFFEWRLKTSLTYTLNKYKAEQMSEGQRLPFESKSINLEPKINWNPLKAFEVDYQASFRYGGNKIGDDTKLSPLLNVVQKLNVSYNFTLLELGFTADHYYNDVSDTKGVHAFLADAYLQWKSGRWQVNATAANLFNKRQYAYTNYSSLQSYTSWINIRGREFRASVSYRF